MIPHGILNAVMVSDDNSQYGACSSILKGTQSLISYGLSPRRDPVLIELRAVFAPNVSLFLLPFGALKHLLSFFILLVLSADP